MDEIPVSKSCRVMRTLDMRAFELKSAVHNVFDRVWNSLVRVDRSAGRLEIHQARDGTTSPFLLAYRGPVLTREQTNQ